MHAYTLKKMEVRHMSKAVILGRVNLPHKGSDGVIRMYSQRPNPSFAYKAPDGKAFATSDERRQYMNDSAKANQNKK